MLSVAFQFLRREFGAASPEGLAELRPIFFAFAFGLGAIMWILSTLPGNCSRSCKSGSGLEGKMCLPQAIEHPGHLRLGLAASRDALNVAKAHAKGAANFQNSPGCHAGIQGAAAQACSVLYIWCLLRLQIYRWRFVEISRPWPPLHT